MRLFKRSPKETPRRRRVERTTVIDPEEKSDVFRRGRTLTGSASPYIKAPSESIADLKSSRVHGHALTRHRRRLFSILVLVLIVTGGLYIAVSEFTADAVVQASPDTSLQLEPVYAAAIDEYLGNHPSERWRFLTDTDRLAEYIQTEVPEVESVAVRGSAGFGKSRFEVRFRQPIASWDVNGRELYVDANGIPFGRNYFAAPLLRITDENGALATATAGQSVMSNRFMGFIGQVIGSAKKQGYEVDSIIIPAGMTRQITVHLKDISYPFKFSSDRPAGEGVDDMVEAIKWLQARQLTPQYVDVRIAGKVFYR